MIRAIRVTGALLACLLSVGASSALASGGTSGGTSPPPLVPGPCVTITMQNPPIQKSYTSTNTLKAQVTSCSSDLESNLSVVFDSATGNPPSSDNFNFSCNTAFFNLSPGASSGVGCQTVANANGAPDSTSGNGTASVYAGCGYDPSLIANPCGTPLASTTYVWAVIVPAPSGGGTINRCTRTFCIP